MSINLPHTSIQRAEEVNNAFFNPEIDHTSNTVESLLNEPTKLAEAREEHNTRLDQIVAATQERTWELQEWVWSYITWKLWEILWANHNRVALMNLHDQLDNYGIEIPQAA